MLFSNKKYFKFGIINFKNFETSSHLNLQKVLGGHIEPTTFTIEGENCCGTDTYDHGTGKAPEISSGTNPDFKRITENDCASYGGLIPASGGGTSIGSAIGGAFSSSRF